MPNQSLRLGRSIRSHSVERLSADAAQRVLEHFLALSAEDRALRFGARCDDDSVARYVAGLDFAAAPVLAAVDRSGALLGVAHVALDRPAAELGLSVVPAARGRGLATTLARRAKREAERAGARELRIHCSADNVGMLKVARKLGMRIERDGAELIARRVLPQLGPARSVPACACRRPLQSA